MSTKMYLKYKGSLDFRYKRHVNTSANILCIINLFPIKLLMIIMDYFFLFLNYSKFSWFDSGYVSIIYQSSIMTPDYKENKILDTRRHFCN